MEFNLGDILNSKNFNRLMFAAAIALGVGWFLMRDNYWLLIAFILTAAYSLITIAIFLFNHIKEAKYESETIKRNHAEEIEKRGENYARAELIFQALSDENKTRLAKIVLKGEKVRAYSDCFIFRHNEEFYQYYNFAIQQLVEATAYGKTYDFLSSDSLVKSGERDNSTIVVVDPSLLLIVRQYIHDNNITAYEQQD